MQDLVNFDALPQPTMPVVTIPDESSVKPMIDALVAGGCELLEITLRTTAGLQAISYARQTYPQVVVGAGSVIGVDEWSQAVDAGSQFLVSPGATDALYTYAKIKPCPWLPGVANASDLMRAHEHGLKHVKFFPASVLGGMPALKSYASVFPNMKFCPTGGVAPDAAAEWLAAPMIFAVGGSWFTPKTLVDAKDWSNLEAHVKRFWQDFAQA